MTLHEIGKILKYFLSGSLKRKFAALWLLGQKLIFYVHVTIFDNLDHLKMYHIFNKLFKKSSGCSI